MQTRWVPIQRHVAEIKLLLKNVSGTNVTIIFGKFWKQRTLKINPSSLKPIIFIVVAIISIGNNNTVLFKLISKVFF